VKLDRSTVIGQSLGIGKERRRRTTRTGHAIQRFECVELAPSQSICKMRSGYSHQVRFTGKLVRFSDNGNSVGLRT
jgi:hypothetical protein